MIEVVIDSIRVSLISQQRIVMLRERDGDQQLPIWIGPCEADSIGIVLQETELSRPMTHDLLRLVIEEMGGTISSVHINELRESVFHALLYIKVKNGAELKIDCRPSDAIALAVRVSVPIFVDELVMEAAGIQPEPDISEPTKASEEEGESQSKNDDDLDPFRNFLESFGED